MNLDTVRSREEAISLLEGYAEERKEEIDKRRTRRPLVKSYMLETVARGRAVPGLDSIFDDIGYRLQRIDDTMFKVFQKDSPSAIGLLESLLDRHPVFYTYEKSQETDKWVRHFVTSSKWLDHVWLSGRALEQLLHIVLRFTPGYRYGRLVFQHESFFETTDQAAPEAETEDEDDQPENATAFDEEDWGGDGDRYVPERRTTRFEVTEQLETLKRILPSMQELYGPLHAVSQIRFPARGRGGHDFYYNGKVTNRSDSFADHQQHVKFVLKIYKKATERAEHTMWQRARREPTIVAGLHEEIAGAPVLLKFSTPLSQETFDRFIKMTFRRSDNRFRLWGNPISLGRRKIHVYGMDCHLWQPIFLEITDLHIVAIVPEGTCGNSIHRLVTNVQQYLDPAIDAWVGDRPYQELIRVEPELKDVYESD